MSSSAIDFYNKWTSDDLDYINTSMRAIRKIQYKCQIVAQHEKNKLHNQIKHTKDIYMIVLKNQMMVNTNI